MARYSYNYQTQKYTVQSAMQDDLNTIIDGFIRNKQIKNFENGQDPGLRAAFIKTHGGAWGTFRVYYDALNPMLAGSNAIKRGVFAKPATYSAWVRFGSDVDVDKSDRNSTVGCSIKLFGVPGLNVLDWAADKDPQAQVTTVDFALQNYQVFFARDARQMAAYKDAPNQPGGVPAFKALPENKQLSDIIAAMMAQDPTSVLTESYWSCVPFAIGLTSYQPSNYVKYIVVPSSGQTYEPASDKSDPTFLRQDLRKNLIKRASKFDFYIHLRNNSSQSIEDASNNWVASTNAATDPRFRTNDVNNIYKIAELVLPQQDITQRGQDNYIESLSFNPWRTLPDNTPYGEIALARRISYEIAAKNRRDLNGQSVGEPAKPRPSAFNDAASGKPEHDVPWSDVSNVPLTPDTPTGDQIVRVAIHPGIGVARVGNSVYGSAAWDGGQDTNDGLTGDYYIGPETDKPPPMRSAVIRDPNGMLRRQAARFRVYGYNAAGDVVREILPTESGVNVEWTVTLANRKAQWFRFDHAWDAPFFKSEAANPSILRNDSITDRASLAITPDPVTVTGPAMLSQPMTGKFRGTPVYLGEARTDKQGRLLVLGGFGRAASTASQADPDATVISRNTGSFNNANQWYDDTSDGPIHAKVTIGGQTFDADPAWVIVAPPNYGPDFVGFRSLWDLLQEGYIQAGILPVPEKVSFSRHILPFLQRLTDLAWVNSDFFNVFGEGFPNSYNFRDPVLVTRLRTPPTNGRDDNLALRQRILAAFQSPFADASSHSAWPLLYGDSFGEDVPEGGGPYLNEDEVADMCALSPLRLSWFTRWANGDFVDDEPPPAYTSISDCPVADQPALLDKAALHFCLADAFHPGCEVTWPMRHGGLYRAPFRIREASADNIYVPQIGETFGYAEANSPGPALGPQPPGGLTRWMALPWHGDTSRCRAGYDAAFGFGDFTPAYWPARVPNSVISLDTAAIILNPGLPKSQRLEAFRVRDKWWRRLSDDADSRTPDEEEAQARYMIANYAKMGVVLQMPTPADLVAGQSGGALPNVLYVEITE